jgi:hypothetical protein
MRDPRQFPLALMITQMFMYALYLVSGVYPAPRIASYIVLTGCWNRRLLVLWSIRRVARARICRTSAQEDCLRYRSARIDRFVRIVHPRE